MTLKLITDAASEPVTLAEAKLHLRVDDSSEDALIAALIQAAREQAQHRTGRALLAQTWERVIDAFPEAEIELGMPPVQSITSIVYVDTAGDAQTLSSAAYVLDADSTPGFVLPADGYDWPSTLDTANAVRVRFVSGYANAAAVPAGIKAWMLLRIGALYQHRSEIVAGVSATAIPGGFSDRLLDPYVVWC